MTARASRAGEPDPTNVNGGDIANTVWFRWTPTANGFASFTFDAPFLGSLAVYTGAAVDSLNPVDSDYDGTSLEITFDAVAGTTYSIQVGAYSDTPGSLSASQLETPVNDHLADAIALSGPSVSIDGEHAQRDDRRQVARADRGRRRRTNASDG